MRKLWMPFVTATLTLVFVLSVGTNSFAANSSVSTYIKGKRNNHWTASISANSKHKIYVVVNTYNNFNVRYYLMDVKTRKKIEATNRQTTHGRTDKGRSTRTFTGVSGKYQLRLYCVEPSWTNNENKCNAKATVYNYKPKGF